MLQFHRQPGRELVHPHALCVPDHQQSPLPSRQIQARPLFSPHGNGHVLHHRIAQKERVDGVHDRRGLGILDATGGRGGQDSLRKKRGRSSPGIEIAQPGNEPTVAVVQGPVLCVRQIRHKIVLEGPFEKGPGSPRCLSPPYLPQLFVAGKPDVPEPGALSAPAPGLFKLSALVLTCGLIMGQAALFIAGVCLAGSWATTCKALLYAPLFLSWKFLIDILSVTGLYSGKTWVRTKRYAVKDLQGGNPLLSPTEKQ